MSSAQDRRDRLRPRRARTLLDHTASLYMLEGGYERRRDGLTTSHAMEERMIVVSGRAGGMLPGRHLRALGTHPVQVVLGAMNAVGVEVERHGEVEGPYAEL